MEYYILKFYENEKQKCDEVEQGFNRFEPEVKRLVIGCLIAMIVALVEMVVTLFLFPNLHWYLVGCIVLLIALLMFLRIDSKDQKKNMDKYVGSYKKKIDILESVLKSEFHISKKEKIEELISMYQEYVDKKKEAEKRRNSIIVTMLSVFAGILTISFENMGLIGLDFSSWIYVATILLIFVFIASVWIYSYTYVDSLKEKYEMMIKDLKELLLLKY